MITVLVWNTKPPPPSPPALYISKYKPAELIFYKFSTVPTLLSISICMHTIEDQLCMHTHTQTHLTHKHTSTSFSHRPQTTRHDSLTHPASSRHSSTHPSMRQSCCPSAGLGHPGSLPTASPAAGSPGQTTPITAFLGPALLWWVLAVTAWAEFPLLCSIGVENVSKTKMKTMGFSV